MPPRRQSINLKMLEEQKKQSKTPGAENINTKNEEQGKTSKAKQLKKQKSKLEVNVKEPGMETLMNQIEEEDKKNIKGGKDNNKKKKVEIKASINK